MSKKHELVPLSQANTDRIRSTVELPFKLEDKVGLNVDRLHTLLQLGGTQSLRITSNPDGETSWTSFSVIGVNGDGSAAAGGVKTKMIPTFTNSVDRMPGSLLTKQALWQNMRVSFNVKELQKRILGGDGDVRQPTRWTKEIDRGLRTSVMQTGERNLLSFGYDSLDKLRNSLWYTFGAVAAATGGAAGVIPYAIVSIPLNLALESFRWGVEGPGRGFRLSLFRGWELDRWLALGMYELTGPVVQEIPK